MELDLYGIGRDALIKLGYFFYIVNPSDHKPEKIEDVKHYYVEVMPYMFFLLLILGIKGALQNNLICIVNMLLRSGAFFMQLTTNFFIEGAAFIFYMWVYKNFRVVTLPCNSSWVWFLGLVAADLWYYCLHRMSHEINLLWALHETHHIPESLNLSTAASLHFLQTVVLLLIPNPLALFLPPALFMVHFHLNWLFQFFIHTEAIGKLPRVIEFLFNTASHHRVHHARNRKYIDKNYGAVLIIWDRLFGTYEEEDLEDKPVYGTTVQMKSYNHLVIQSRHFRNVWEKFWEVKGFRNKLSAVFKGPGWSPGKPWNGDNEDILHPPPPFEPLKLVLPKWHLWYWIIHDFVIGVDYVFFVPYLSVLSTTTSYAVFSFVVFTEVVFGLSIDGNQYAVSLEVLRILMYFAVENTVYPGLSKHGLVQFVLIIHRTMFSLSLLMWVAIAVYRMALKIDDRRTKNPTVKPYIQSILYSRTPEIIISFGRDKEKSKIADKIN